MTKLDAVNKIKEDRSNLREKVVKGIQLKVEQCARGGHFPDFDQVVKDVMATIANEIAENPEIPRKQWIVMLQFKEPDRFCQNTVSVAEELCQEK